jgi:hypothetical protein
MKIKRLAVDPKFTTWTCTSTPTTNTRSEDCTDGFTFPATLPVGTITYDQLAALKQFDMVMIKRQDGYLCRDLDGPPVIHEEQEKDEDVLYNLHDTAPGSMRLTQPSLFLGSTNGEATVQVHLIFLANSENRFSLAEMCRCFVNPPSFKERMVFVDD